MRRRKSKGIFLKIFIIIILVIAILLSFLLYKCVNENNALNNKVKELDSKYHKINNRFKSKYIFDKSVYNELKGIDLEGSTKLMIVAHPDDESIFGGNHLIKNGEDYLVVCITCKTNSERELEFEKVMQEYGSKYLSLAYVDSNKTGISDWGGKLRYEIYRSLEEVIGYKDWKLIITHNPDGEYSHWHHKMSSTIVKDITQSLGLYDNLYYFDKYVEPNEVKKLKEHKLSKEELERKEEIIYSIYLSQYWACKNLEHIFPYENWIKATDWNYD